MRKLFLVILLFWFSAKHTTQIQAQDYMDLLLLYVDEKYDICFHKSKKTYKLYVTICNTVYYGYNLLNILLWHPCCSMEMDQFADLLTGYTRLSGWLGRIQRVGDSG